jgi:hypothetical protein
MITKKEDLYGKYIETFDEATLKRAIIFVESLGFEPSISSVYDKHCPYLCLSRSDKYYRNTYVGNGEQIDLDLEVKKHKFKVYDKVIVTSDVASCYSKDNNGKFKKCLTWWQKGSVKVIKLIEGDFFIIEGDKTIYHCFNDWDLFSSDLPEKNEIDAKIQKNNKGEIKMELKEVNKKNLVEAQKQFKAERMNAEIEFAKQQLRLATDEKLRIDRKEETYKKELMTLREVWTETYKEIVNLL